MTRKGVWGLQGVRDKQLQSLWEQSYTLWAMGQGNKGEIGNNENGDGASRSSPTQIPGSWATINAGTYGCYFATRTNGELWVGGANNFGQLGLNQRGLGDSGSTYRSSPAQVPGSWDRVSCVNYAALGFKTDGTLWSWGANAPGALGLNNRTQYSSPVQIGTGTDWSSNFEAAYNSGAIKTDGTLWVWGMNNQGRLGLNEPAGPGHKSSPTQLPGTTWSFFANGGSTNGAIKTDGTLWLWGNNEVGELGQNSTNEGHSSPIQVGTDTTWADVALSQSSGEAGVAAVKTDGTLWSWGGNEQAELGQNDKTDYSSPKQIGTDTDWKYVWGDGAEAARHFFATKTDGTIWNWGRGSYGTLDHNAVIGYSSPMQIGTDTVFNLNKKQVGVGDRTCYVMEAVLTPSQL